MAAKVVPISPEHISQAAESMRDGNSIIGAMWAALIELTFAALALVGYLAWRPF